MERNVKHLPLRKTDVLKILIFHLKKCTDFEEQKYILKVYLGEYL